MSQVISFFILIGMSLVLGGLIGATVVYGIMI